jgi:hypothetical protein
MFVKTEGNEGDCKWEIVQPSILSEHLINIFSVVFSDDNSLVANIEGDTLLFVINSIEELSNIMQNVNTVIDDIDFETQSIVWGKFITSSISDTISSKQLYVCDTDYKYDVIVYCSTEGWPVLNTLYFWDVYPKKIDINNLLLTVE